MAVRLQRLTGRALSETLDEIAALRIAVFREWPYLYDGDTEYERGYLKRYLESPRAIVVGAYREDRLVGVTTGTPLADHAGDFGQAFASTGLAISDIFYCAESVLLPAFRGQGVGHAFFDARETHAQESGFKTVCFCSVLRPEDHSERPLQYRPLDAFWRKRGYEPLPDVIASFSWKDLGEEAETRKPLQFWMRRL
ncbi:MAG: GNAT family N-acetyltransferase [Paracoccaceae bacterium]|nr:GNAT family N-acetyltransferase [Paracoccaceae bacterium]